MNEHLDAQVLRLLNKRRGDWPAVSKDAGVSYSWLSKFANGHIDNPGFQTLKRLHRVLTAKNKPATAREAA